VHTESKNKTEAHEKVLETASEKALLQEVINHMCENVVRIAEVSLLMYSLEISLVLVFPY
jgi:predicted metal-dependent TIM-barrel fold hydrolase